MTDRELADAMAGNIRSFVTPVPFMAPEALGFHVQTKLVAALELYESHCGEQSDEDWWRGVE